MLLALAGWGLQALGVFEPLDRRLLDWAFLARGEHGRTSPVVLVAILDIPGTASGYADLWFDSTATSGGSRPCTRRASRPSRASGWPWPSALGERGRCTSPPVARGGAPRPVPACPSRPTARVLEGEVPGRALRDKVVLVGSTAFTVDNFFTPFYSRVLPETRRRGRAHRLPGADGLHGRGRPRERGRPVEAMSGELEAEIVITQPTYDLVKFQVEAEALGFHPVRGRHDPVALYRVRGLKEEAR